MYRKSQNAIVHCRSCQAKITKMDETCPKCGSPTSRVIPVLLGIAVLAAAILVVMAFNDSMQQAESDVTAVKYKQGQKQAKESMMLQSDASDN